MWGRGLPDSRAIAASEPRGCGAKVTPGSGIGLGPGAPSIVPIGELAAIALGRPTLLDGQRRLRGECALAREFLAPGEAFGRLLVELLRHRGGAAHVAEPLHHHRAGDGALAQLDGVALAQLARGLGELAVDLHALAADLLGSEAAGLEEAGGPQPLVEAHAGRGWRSHVGEVWRGR